MKNFPPDKKFKGDAKAFGRLDRAIKKAIKQDSELRFEYEKENINLHIAATINKLRTDAGLTQMQLAKKVGFSQPFIARLENPRAEKKPNLETFAKVLGAFDKRIRIEVV
jgi:DNA-binding XRE family transcriptional regulator